MLGLDASWGDRRVPMPRINRLPPVLSIHSRRRLLELTLNHCRLSAEGGCDTDVARAFDNRPISSRSQALFRSITEVKHALRQHQFNHYFQRSITLFSRPSMVVENPACMAGGDSPRVGPAAPIRRTSRT